MQTAASQALDEVKRLQGCIDDLIGVQALAGIWLGLDEPQIVTTLLDTLVRVLRLEFACARLHPCAGGASIDTIRVAPQRNPEMQRLQRLTAWLKGELPATPAEIPNPLGAGTIMIATARLGLQDDLGLVITASRNSAFPTEVDMLMLRTAASQAVIALQETRLRKRAEERLRRSEAHLADNQRLSRTGIWSWNVSSGELLFSDETFAILGFVPEEPAPSLRATRRRIHKDDRLSVQRVIEAAVREKKDYECEARLSLPHGSLRHVHCIGRPFINESGCLEYVGTLLDVTQRKRTEESLLAAESQLAHAARVTTMEELAASIAHEIKQPLAAAGINANACLRWLAGAEPNLEEARAALTRIVNQTERASQVVDGIRACMKRSQTDASTVVMNDLIQEVLALTRHYVSKQGIRLRTDLARDLRHILGDAVQLQQVMANLIVNAIDATSVRPAGRRELVVSSRNDGSNQIVISVRDSGVGIDPTGVEDLFKPFVTSKPDGLGMGLPISRSIVEAHGGRLFAAPNPDQGATFRFSLPANGAVPRRH